jgi:hypothetical protein
MSNVLGEALEDVSGMAVDGVNPPVEVEVERMV